MSHLKWLFFIKFASSSSIDTLEFIILNIILASFKCLNWCPILRGLDQKWNYYTFSASRYFSDDSDPCTCFQFGDRRLLLSYLDCHYTGSDFKFGFSTIVYFTVQNTLNTGVELGVYFIHRFRSSVGPVVQNYKIYVIPNAVIKLNDYVVSLSYSIS
jgi:hypothetical protein